METQNGRFRKLDLARMKNQIDGTAFTMERRNLVKIQNEELIKLDFSKDRSFSFSIPSSLNKYKPA